MAFVYLYDTVKSLSSTIVDRSDKTFTHVVNTTCRNFSVLLAWIKRTLPTWKLHDEREPNKRRNVYVWGRIFNNYERVYLLDIWNENRMNALHVTYLLCTCELEHRLLFDCWCRVIKSVHYDLQPFVNSRKYRPQMCLPSITRLYQHG